MMKKMIFGGVIALILVAVISFKAGSFVTTTKSTRFGLDNIGELATQVAYVTQVNDDQQRPYQLLGLPIPFTQSHYIYSYDVQVKAGMDFGDIQWKQRGDEIVVTLPEIRVLSSELDLDSFKVYLESESLFRKVSLNQTNKATKHLKQEAQQTAIKNGLLEQAEKNAKTLITKFFHQEQAYQDKKIVFQNAKK